MKIERNLAYAAIAVCTLPLLAWLSVFWTPWFSESQTRWSEFGSFWGGVLSPVLAFASFTGLLATLREQKKVAETRKRQADDLNYFNHATASIQRAYETLTQNKTKAAPVADRLAWLSCARLLLSAQEVAKRISGESEGLIALYDGECEHWRWKFYEALHPEGQLPIGRQASYFAHPNSRIGVNIEKRSIRVVFEFSNWPEGKMDSVDTVPKYSAVELDAMSASMSGVREYVRSMPRFHLKSDD